MDVSGMAIVIVVEVLCRKPTATSGRRKFRRMSSEICPAAGNLIKGVGHTWYYGSAKSVN